MGWASDTLAQISREQWADYQKRFIPLENELMAAYNNQEQAAERIGAARELSGKAFDTAERGGRIEAARYGLNLNDDPANLRQLSMGRAAASVDAANTTRQHLAARDQLLLAGGLTTKGV